MSLSKINPGMWPADASRILLYTFICFFGLDDAVLPHFPLSIPCFPKAMNDATSGGHHTVANRTNKWRFQDSARFTSFPLVTWENCQFGCLKYDFYHQSIINPSGSLAQTTM